MNRKILFQIMGCLFLLVASPSTNAQSTLTLDELLNQAPIINTALPFTATGNLTDASVRVAGQNEGPEFGSQNRIYHPVVYKMTLTENSKIVTKFKMISGSDTLSTMIYLYKKQSSGTGGYELVNYNNDDEYDNDGNVYLFSTLQPGEYYWVGTSYDSEQTGSFELHFQNQPAPKSFTDLLSNATEINTFDWDSMDLNMNIDSYYVAGQTSSQFGLNGLNYFATAYKTQLSEKKTIQLDVYGDDFSVAYVYQKNQDGSVAFKGKYDQDNCIELDAGEYYFVFTFDITDTVGSLYVTLKDAQLDVWVNGEDILQAPNYTVACGNGTAVYNPDANTLTLNNAEITHTNYDVDNFSVESGILIKNGALKMILVGTNSINVLATIPGKNNSYLSHLSGIYLQKSIASIEGTSGMLNISTSGHLNSDGAVDGVLSLNSTLTIESGTLNLKGGISNDTISYGCYLSDSKVIIRGGTGTSEGNLVAFNLVPQFENNTGITSGEWHDKQCGWGDNGIKPYGVFANGEEFNSSKNIITCGAGTAQYDPVNNQLVLHNATIQSSSDLLFSFDGPLQNTSMGIAAINTNTQFEILLEGTNTIQQTASADAVVSIGILIMNNLTIRGDGALNVTAGEAADISLGICSLRNLTVQSGTVTSTGGTGSGTAGIYALETFLQSGGYVAGQGGDVVSQSSGGPNIRPSYGIASEAVLVFGGAGVAQGLGVAFAQNPVFGVRVSIIDGAPLQTHCSWESAYTLSFDLNGGDGVNPDSKTVAYAKAIGELPIPTKSGATFAGWKTGNDLLTDQSIWNYNDDQTAVAQWTDLPAYLPQENQASLAIVPNPTTEWVKIQGITGTVTMQILDLNGRIVLEQQVSANRKINVSSLQSGIYLVRINAKTLKLVVE